MKGLNEYNMQADNHHRLSYTLLSYNYNKSTIQSKYNVQLHLASYAQGLVMNLTYNICRFAQLKIVVDIWHQKK